jgi:hypothetical protein
MFDSRISGGLRSMARHLAIGTIAEVLKQRLVNVLG